MKGQTLLLADDLRLLFLISSGVDSWASLMDETGMVRSSLSRRLSALEGQVKSDCKSLSGLQCAALVTTRKHPHQRGREWRLTEVGEEMVQEWRELMGRSQCIK